MATSTISNNSAGYPAQAAVQQIQPKPTAEKVAVIKNQLSNPRAPLIQPEILVQLTFADWMTALNQFKTELASRIGTGLNPDLKLDVQQRMKSEQEAQVANDYLTALTRVQEQIELYQKDLVREIKSRKFPQSNAHLKEYFSSGTTIKDEPDWAARAVGATELQLAANTPLKYINSQVLRNYWQAGRTDLVSALIERFALNRGQFETAEATEIQKLALEFYEAINVQSERQVLKYVNAIIDVLKNYKLTSAVVGNTQVLAYALRAKQVETEFQRAIGADSLLEL